MVAVSAVGLATVPCRGSGAGPLEERRGPRIPSTPPGERCLPSEGLVDGNEAQRFGVRARPPAKRHSGGKSDHAGGLDGENLSTANRYLGSALGSDERGGSRRPGPRSRIAYDQARAPIGAASMLGAPTIRAARDARPRARRREDWRERLGSAPDDRLGSTNADPPSSRSTTCPPRRDHRSAGRADEAEMRAWIRTAWRRRPVPGRAAPRTPSRHPLWYPR